MCLRSHSHLHAPAHSTPVMWRLLTRSSKLRYSGLVLQTPAPVCDRQLHLLGAQQHVMHRLVKVSQPQQYGEDGHPQHDD